MRLLNTETLRMEEFWDMQTPAFGILSHTWGKEEVSFQAIGDIETASHLAGYSKIQACCQQAQKDGYEWVWIDTCCIDKSSSAELSEAINSMFYWYEKSSFCYAYLADVPPDDDPRDAQSLFTRSRWFTRGWTLQELIAPPEMEFFFQDWTKAGSRRDLSSQISQITRIDTGILLGEERLQSRSIAQRMSWASRRLTTRREDVAYCLLGIFGVNIPLLYGEGNRAFIRLQEEILKRSHDQTIFAWTDSIHDAAEDGTMIVRGGLLAKSPSDFENSSHYVPARLMQNYQDRPYSMTNMGVCLDLPILRVSPKPKRLRREQDWSEWVAILAVQSTHHTDNDIWDTRSGIHLALEVEPSLGTQRSESYYSTSGRGLRHVNRSLATLNINEHNYFGSKEYITIEWNTPNPNRRPDPLKEIQAGWATVYIAQEERYSVYYPPTASTVQAPRSNNTAAGVTISPSSTRTSAGKPSSKSKCSTQ